MLTSGAKINPEDLHPSLWRASQLARGHSRCVSTGHQALDNQLPGGGWPTGSMTDLLTQQPGICELRLLAPAVSQVANRQIAFLQPPHPPQTLALAAMGIPPESALWLRADRTADALWAAEQVLRSGSCGALLLHGDESAALGDAGYQSVEKRAENLGKSVTWHVAMKRSKRKALPKNKLGRMLEKLEHLKASVRAKVEHPFHVIKNLFRHRKTRYRGLAKNTAQLFTLFGFANLVLAGRRFTITETRSAS